MTAASWHVVQTQPRAEETAQKHLRNQGFTAYVPRYRRHIAHARRRSVVLRPLFPGYLFVQLDLDHSPWRSINGTVGVRRILTEGESPRRMPSGVIQEIMGREDGEGLVTLTPSLMRGQTVRMMHGPMVGIDGIFEEWRDEMRVVLLFSLLGRQVRAVVAVEEIAPAN